jgi:preprotein translocase subunit YajC
MSGIIYPGGTVNFVVLAQEGGGGTSSLIFLALMIAVFYFLIIRPQRRRAKDQEALSASLVVGQEVRTIGGIHGTILSVGDDSVVLRVEEGKIRVSRRAIAARVGADAETPSS